MDSETTASRAAILRGTWFHALVLGIAYFALGLIANLFVLPPHPSSMLWLPSGLSLAFLLRSPPRRWPALLAAIFVAELLSIAVHGFPIPVWIAGMWGVANCLRALSGAWLMRRFVGTPVQLSRRREIAGLLVFGGLVSP